MKNLLPWAHPVPWFGKRFFSEGKTNRIPCVGYRIRHAQKIKFMSVNLLRGRPLGRSLERLCLTVVIIISGVCELTSQTTETKSPEARYLHQMVFDEGTGQVLVYGGTCG